jgi:hypothetical protein
MIVATFATEMDSDRFVDSLRADSEIEGRAVATGILAAHGTPHHGHRLVAVGIRRELEPSSEREPRPGVASFTTCPGAWSSLAGSRSPSRPAGGSVEGGWTSRPRRKASEIVLDARSGTGSDLKGPIVSANRVRACSAGRRAPRR